MTIFAKDSHLSGAAHGIIMIRCTSNIGLKFSCIPAWRSRGGGPTEESEQVERIGHAQSLGCVAHLQPLYYVLTVAAHRVLADK